MQTAVIAQASVRVRYLQPYEDAALGGGTFALDLAVERIERRERGWRIVGSGTTRPGPIDLEVDEAIAPPASPPRSSTSATWACGRSPRGASPP